MATIHHITPNLAKLHAKLEADAAAALAILKFFRTLAFHPAALLPFACGILVLFFALAGILSGLMLLRRRTVENA